MEPILLAAIISALVTAIGLLFGYSQWRRDVQIKLGQLRETVSVELIRERIEPYSCLMKQLETVSSVHKDDLQNHPERILAFVDVLQEALYGKVGLLASHETRLVLLYARSGCRAVAEGKVPFDELRLRLWALHLSLRSDLGIAQPMWSSEIERIRESAAKQEARSTAELVKSYPWENVYYHQVSEEAK